MVLSLCAYYICVKYSILPNEFQLESPLRQEPSFPTLNILQTH